MVIPQPGDAVQHPSRTAHTLALLTSLICMAGFALDMLALSLGPNLSSSEWRMGFMQQLGTRCIVLLFGTSLLCYSLQTRPLSLRRIAWVCCGLGLCLSLSSLFYLQDSLRFQSLAIENLTTQRQSLEQQIQQFTPQTPTPSELAVDPARRDQAIELLRQRTQTLSLRARVRIQKTIARTFCSLLLVGVGLVTLGQITLKSTRFLETRHHPETALEPGNIP